MPKIQELNKLRIQCENQRDPEFSLVKAKKYETLIVQIWECLPIFMRYNSPKLAEAVSSLLGQLDPLVNKNTLNLRSLALKSFSELIGHCRNTPVVDDQIKKTRLGLQRISMDYVEGLSKLYVTPNYDSTGVQIALTTEESGQILKTL